ncbi:MAG TPA: MFS transporter [Thermomicrobiales bacterium]|nr:MFS transporter [Thermomicrobiales bacterium]
MQSAWQHVLVSPNAPNKLPIAALLIANAVSLIGSSLTMIAVPWFVLTTTGSAGKAGLTGAFEFLPAFFAGILGGAVIDRIGPRTAALIADLVSGLSILMIPLLYHTIGLAFWQLLLFVFLGSMLSIPGTTARRTMLPDLSALGNVRLERVNAILEGNQNVAMFLGPPLAGVLIAVMGASNVLWLDGASSLISVVTVLCFVPDLRNRAERLATSFVTEIKEGLTWLWHDQVVRMIAISLLSMNALTSPFFGLIFAVYIKNRYDDPRILGLVFSIFSLGLLAGTTLYGVFGIRIPRRALVVLFLLGASIAYWPMATDLPLIVLLVCAAITGLTDGPVNPLFVTVRLERIPPELRGRVFSATSAFAQLMPAAVIPIAGLMIQQIGLRPTVLIFASATLVVGSILSLSPAWTRLNEARGGGLMP